MRSDDEEDEDEYDENEDNEDEVDLTQMDGDGDGDADGDGEGDEADDNDAGGDEEDDGDGDGDGEGEEEDEDEDGDGDDVDGDAEEDEDEEDGDGDGDGDGEGDDDEDDDEAEDEDGDTAQPEHPSSPAGSAPSPGGSNKRTASPRLVPIDPVPPHKIRRSLLIPSFATTSPRTLPKTLAVDAVVAIPIPAPVHCLAATACSSYLLTGSQEGVIRAYDFYASVNGGQMMTAQQKAVVGMGETVSKAGVGRGWWVSDIPFTKGNGGVEERRAEPVYSLAVEGDGLWALSGTQSGPINLYTLRHSPGHLVHSLKGHTNVVSALALTTDEKHVLSGSWDGSIREWDLNTGTSTRSYPTHGAQISSLSLRPYSHPITPALSRRDSDGEGEDDKMGGDRETPKGGMAVSVNVGPDFYASQRVEDTNGTASDHREARGKGTELNPASNVDSAEPAIQTNSNESTDTIDDDDHTALASIPKDEPAQVEAALATKTSRASSYDPLFDDEDEDAEGEEVTASAMATKPTSPVSAPAPDPAATPGGSTSAPSRNAFALPTNDQSSATNARANGNGSIVPSAPAHTASTSTSRPAGAASSIPLLSPTSYKAFSDDILLASFMDGQVTLIDRRVRSNGHGGGGGAGGGGVGRLLPGDKAPPWCMSACWSGDGNQILAGRRNGTIDIWDVRRSSSSTAPNLLRTLKTPPESGPVSCVVAFPDGQHIATASQDNIRLWNTVEYFEPEEPTKKSRSRPPFKIVAGHHGGTVSSMLVDPTCRFMTIASGDRGWAGESTKMVLIHEIKW